jgi:hypothetical protein
MQRGEAERAPGWRRGFAITLVIFVGIMLTSRMNVLQHHMITALPLAVVVVVVAFHTLAARLRLWGYAAAAIGVFCITVIVYWDVTAALGLQRTGGVGHWSDAIYRVTDTIVRDHPRQPIKVLDWGFGNNLYVISNGQIRAVELFWGATIKATAFGERWSDVVARGGVFLTGGDRSLNGAFAPTITGFREALAAAHVTYRVTQFRERGGAVFAELIEVGDAASSDGQVVH